MRAFSVEYRKPSSGRSGWKRWVLTTTTIILVVALYSVSLTWPPAIRCREQATLRLRVEGVGAGSSGAPQLCYEVDVSGKVHESGRLAADSAVACGNVDGLKPEIQPHTLRITEDARSPAKSFCGGPWPPSPSHAPCPAAPRQL